MAWSDKARMVSALVRRRGSIGSKYASYGYRAIRPKLGNFHITKTASGVFRGGGPTTYKRIGKTSALVTRGAQLAQSMASSRRNTMTGLSGASRVLAGRMKRFK